MSTLDTHLVQAASGTDLLLKTATPGMRVSSASAAKPTTSKRMASPKILPCISTSCCHHPPSISVSGSSIPIQADCLFHLAHQGTTFPRMHKELRMASSSLGGVISGVKWWATDEYTNASWKSDFRVQVMCIPTPHLRAPP